MKRSRTERDGKEEIVRQERRKKRKEKRVNVFQKIIHTKLYATLSGCFSDKTHTKLYAWRSS